LLRGSTISRMTRFVVFFLLFTITTMSIQWIAADDEVSFGDLLVKTSIAGLIASAIFTLLTNRRKKREPK